VLGEYHWPGNVRELKNLIERIVILNPQVRVDARHIPLNARRPAERRRSASAACRKCAKRPSANTF
jgi:two-component system, NtrC family, nitrogen regulation response regulator NtrX